MSEQSQSWYSPAVAALPGMPSLYSDVQHLLRDHKQILQQLAEIQAEQVLAGQIERDFEARMDKLAVEVHDTGTRLGQLADNVGALDNRVMALAAVVQAILDSLTPPPVVGIDVEPGPVTPRK